MRNHWSTPSLTLCHAATSVTRGFRGSTGRPWPCGRKAGDSGCKPTNQSNQSPFPAPSQVPPNAWGSKKGLEQVHKILETWQRSNMDASKDHGPILHRQTTSPTPLRKRHPNKSSLFLVDLTKRKPGTSVAYARSHPQYVGCGHAQQPLYLPTPRTQNLFAHGSYMGDKQRSNLFATLSPNNIAPVGG